MLVNCFWNYFWVFYVVILIHALHMTCMGNSQDMDDESAEEKRVAIGRGASAKKSRAAEVHNMSERVRISIL